jgi:hypothetical protein
MRALRAVPKKIGINPDGLYRYKDINIVQGDANAMTRFGDQEFDTV